MTRQHRFGDTVLYGIQNAFTSGTCVTTQVQDNQLVKMQTEIAHSQCEIDQLKTGMRGLMQGTVEAVNQCQDHIDHLHKGQVAYNKKMAADFTSLKEDVENNKTQTKQLAKATADKMGQLKSEIESLNKSRERQAEINHGLQKQISELRAENETLRRHQSNLEARQNKLEDDFEDLLNQINNI